MVAYQRLLVIMNVPTNNPWVSSTHQPRPSSMASYIYKLRPTRAFAGRLVYLNSSKLYLKDSVKCITLSYRTTIKSSKGLREFISEVLPPIQFKNPEVQISLFKNAYHYKFPAINVYFVDGRNVLMDMEGKNSETILSELTAIAGKTEEQVQKAKWKAEYNPANFGNPKYGRVCICEVPGQVPCPAKVPLKNVEHKWQDKNTDS